MKRFGKALIVAGILVVSGILIGCIGNTIIVTGGEKATKAAKYEEKYYTVAASGINMVETDLSTDDIRVELGDSDDIEILYWDEVEEPKYQITEQNGTLRIDRKATNSIWLIQIPTFWEMQEDNEIHEVTIRIPKEYIGSYELGFSSGSVSVTDLTIEGELSVNGSSGNVTLENIKCKEELRLDMTSGSLKLQDVEVEGDLGAYLTSGDTMLTDVSIGGSFNMDMTSGDVEAENIDVKGVVNFYATSGSVSCDVLNTKELFIDATSGDYDLTQVTVEEGIYVDATSGDITVSLTDAMENYSISTDITSGNCNLPNNYGKGGKTIFVSLTSGDADFTFEEAE